MSSWRFWDPSPSPLWVSLLQYFSSTHIPPDLFPYVCPFCIRVFSGLFWNSQVLLDYELLEGDMSRSDISVSTDKKVDGQKLLSSVLCSFVPGECPCFIGRFSTRTSIFRSPNDRLWNFDDRIYTNFSFSFCVSWGAGLVLLLYTRFTFIVVCLKYIFIGLFKTSTF